MTQSWSVEQSSFVRAICIDRMRNSLLHYFCSKSWSGLFRSDGPMVFGVSDPGHVCSGYWLDSTATPSTAKQRNLFATTSAYHHRFGNECMPRSHSPYIAWENSLGRIDPPARVFKMSHAKQVSLATFESEVLESSMPVVVDFYADWCAPCRMLGPVLDRVSTAFDGRAKIVKVNIESIPTFLYATPETNEGKRRELVAWFAQ